MRHLTVDDLWLLPRVGNPAPAPDGKSFLVPVTNCSLQDNRASTRLWHVPAAAKSSGTGEDNDPARALTSSEYASSQPAWSPAGDRIAFVRKPGEGAAADKQPAGEGAQFADKGQLYLMSLDGGEATRLTDLPLGAIDPHWFPDGERLAFVAPVYADAPGLEATAKRHKRIREEPVKARITEDRFYRYWDQWLTDGIVHHIFQLELKSGEVTDLTPGLKGWLDPMSPGGKFSIAPDGREIVFEACSSKPPHDRLRWGCFRVSLPAKPRPAGRSGALVEFGKSYKGSLSRPIHSPDGRWILFGMQREFDFYADRVRLVARERSSGREIVLTENWKLSASGWSFDAQGRRVYLVAEERGHTAIFSLDFKAALRHPEKVLPKRLIKGGTYGAPQVAGERIFLGHSSLCEPPEVRTCDLEGRRMRRATAFTAPGLKGIKLSEMSEEVFSGHGGRKVQMLLLHPPGEKPLGPRSRRRPEYPLVHLIHGGPHGAFNDQWHWRWNAQVFSGPGYLSAMVNFHGSTGWGQRFASSILGSWGDQPYDDVMAATDHLIERGLADPKRLAATGGSYGGYLVAWIASQTKRFACLINHAGVNDLQAQYASDWTQGRARSMGGEPWDNIEGLDRYNPMRHAAGFHSPMLVMHGEQDYRVPYTQGIEIYNVYKAMKKPARLVVFPDENHWILKPRNSRLWYNEFHAWLARWLKKKRTRKTR
ncbi:MAG: S9 family peptidase [bacterium]|nr:S9 family peptidase [bacterium]